MTEDDTAWRGAFKALIGDNPDPKPLARMLHSTSPIPNWIRQELAELLDPMRPLALPEDAPDPKGRGQRYYDVEGTRILIDRPNKRTQLNLKNADRLIFTRTQATKRKMKTFEKRAATGLAVLDARAAGMPHAKAVAKVVDEIGKEDADSSYVNHSVKAARDLPPHYQALARKATARKK